MSSNLVVSLLFWGSFDRLWTYMIHLPDKYEIALLAVAAGFLTYMITAISRTTSIDPELKTAVIRSTLFNHPVKEKHFDLSTSAWIQARHIGSKLDSKFECVALEVGTVGYKTTRLMSLPYDSGKGIPDAEMWCERIAASLGIQNKGYMQLW